MSRATPIPARNRRIVQERCGGLCEGCGKQPATELHHRKYRSRGGGHEVSNLIYLCGWGNHTGCHGVAHSAEGHELGWSVNSWGNPQLSPVHYRGEQTWLTTDGRAVPVKPEPDF
jgi:5-methylcytosine-specific restriction endonuclease McrA